MSKVVIKTACWFAALPADHVKIGISRGVPKGQPDDTLLYRRLNPGYWFKSVGPAEYLQRYGKVLANIDAQWLAPHLQYLAQGRIPVLCCWETARDIDAGKNFCHRHLVASWLEKSLGTVVEEFGFPYLDRWAFLRNTGVLHESEAPRPIKPPPLQPLLI